MLKLAVSVAVLFLAISNVAGDDDVDQSQCALDGAPAADAAIEAAISIWAATKRCAKAGSAATQTQAAQCTFDVTGAISSLSSMATAIAGAVQNCGTFQGDNACGLAAGTLVSATTALASASAACVVDCTGPPIGKIPGFHPETTDLGECVADISASVNGIFQSANALKNIKAQCDDGDACAQNSMNVLSALTGMAGAMTASSNDCDQSTLGLGGKGAGAGFAKVGCAADILTALSSLHDVVNSALQVADACEGDAKRLYQANREVIKGVSSSTQQNIMLGALLPLGALVSFVVGLLVGRRRNVKDHARLSSQTNDLELLEPVAE